MSSRRHWADEMIRRASASVPPYGSDAWCQLPESSPAKVAAVVIAAEAWATTGDHLEMQLSLEVEVSRHAFKADEDAAYRDRAAAHRERWRHLPLTAPGRYAGQVVEPLDAIGRRHVEQRRAAS